MCLLWLCEIVSNIPDTFSSSLKDHAFLLILQPLTHSEPKEQDLRCPKMFLFLSTTHAHGISAPRFARRMILHRLIRSISVCHPSFFSRLIYVSFKFLLFIFSFVLYLSCVWSPHSGFLCLFSFFAPNLCLLELTHL